MNTLIARANCTYKGDLKELEVANMLQKEGDYKVVEGIHPHYQIEHETLIEDDENGEAIVFLVKMKNAGLLSTLSKAIEDNLATGDCVASNISFEIGESYGN